MYKIAVCDDDSNYRFIIKELIIKNYKICENVIFYEYSSGEELLNHIDEMHNLLFLDICMEGMDGNETAKKFRSLNKKAILIFCTNYQSPTTESFKVQPYRYIIKDLHNQMLKEEIQDILQEMIIREKIEYLNITLDGKFLKIPIDQIAYISIAKRGSVIHQYIESGEAEIYCRENIKTLYNKLSTVGFEYAHHSYIVNMTNIIHVDKNIITLKNNIQLNISRSRQKNFDNRFSSFLCMRYKRK